MKHQAVLIMYRFVSWNYRIFVSHPDLKLSETPETNLNKPKWRLKRHKKTNQSKTKRNKVKQSTKTKKWGNSGRDCVITVVLHPKLLVSVQPDLRNLPFCYYVKQRKLSSLFWIVSKLFSVLVSLVLIWTEFRRTPWVSELVSFQLFWIESWYLWFNRNSDTNCFAIS